MRDRRKGSGLFGECVLFTGYKNKWKCLKGKQIMALVWGWYLFGGNFIKVEISVPNSQKIHKRGGFFVDREVVKFLFVLVVKYWGDGQEAVEPFIPVR